MCKVFRVTTFLCNLRFPYAFSESLGSIEYCYVFGFLWTRGSLPCLRLKHAVGWMLPVIQLLTDECKSTPLSSFWLWKTRITWLYICSYWSFRPWTSSWKLLGTYLCVATGHKGKTRRTDTSDLWSDQFCFKSAKWLNRRKKGIRRQMGSMVIEEAV